MKRYDDYAPHQEGDWCRWEDVKPILDLLKQLEYVSPDRRGVSHCPLCYEWEGNGHIPQCELGQLLKKD